MPPLIILILEQTVMLLRNNYVILNTYTTKLLIMLFSKIIRLYTLHIYSIKVVILFILLFIGSEAKANEDVKCGTSAAFQLRYNKSESALADCQQPIMQKTVISQLGKFAIHYDLTGVHAVPSTDNDGNGIPDYVDSAAYYFDFSYTFETQQLGYPPAPTIVANGKESPYDVFLWNIATVPLPPTNTYGVYGVTLTCGAALAGGLTYRYKTYIVIDNDFSVRDSINKKTVYNTFNIDALKVTAAHEYHHAIQIGNYGYSVSNTAPYETTSTWMEVRIFPQVHDYVNYLKGFFSNDPDKRYGIGDQSAGYGNILFYLYLSKTFDDVIIKRMWEIIGKGTNVFRALDAALVERNSDLNDAWCGFMPWMYYTGARSKPAQYFPDAVLYPMLLPATQEIFAEPSLLRTGPIHAFEMQLTRVVFRKTNPSISPDTADFLITNPNKEVAFMQNDLWKNLEFVISHESFPNQIQGTPYSWKLSPPELCAPLFFTAGISTTSLDYAYPSPFYVDESYAELKMPVPPSANFTDKIILSVYTPSWKNIYSGEHFAEADNDHKIIRWKPNAEILNTGVYIYTIGNKNDIIAQGKFTVIKK